MDVYALNLVIIIAILMSGCTNTSEKKPDPEIQFKTEQEILITRAKQRIVTYIQNTGKIPINDLGDVTQATHDYLAIETNEFKMVFKWDKLKPQNFCSLLLKADSSPESYLACSAIMFETDNLKASEYLIKAGAELEKTYPAVYSRLSGK